MRLDHLPGKKRLVILGLNSGTSADGVDLAAVAISRRGSRCTVKFLGGAARRYPPQLRELVLTTADSRVIDLNHLVYLDQILGRFYAAAAHGYLNRLAAQGIVVDAVASHGQTVRHLPGVTVWKAQKLRGSLQLGSLEAIAARTGRVTVGDFRQADIALGNEGAPITVAAVARLFADRHCSRLIVNIGGMSNFFYLPSRAVAAAIRAADCGPGNSLCDLLARRLYDEPYDRHGRHASSGTPSQRLLALLLGEAFFHGAGVSTGRETFGPKMAERMARLAGRFGMSGDDLIATAAELTVRSIARRILPLLAADRSLDNLYLTGGGAHNKFFVRRLSELTGGLKVASVAALGIPPKLVEASSYAVMAEACLRSEALPTRFVDGVRQRVCPVLGRIVQPPKEK